MEHDAVAVSIGSHQLSTSHWKILARMLCGRRWHYVSINKRVISWCHHRLKRNQMELRRAKSTQHWRRGTPRPRSRRDAQLALPFEMAKTRGASQKNVAGCVTINASAHHLSIIAICRHAAPKDASLTRARQGRKYQVSSRNRAVSASVLRRRAPDSRCARPLLS